MREAGRSERTCSRVPLSARARETPRGFVVSENRVLRETKATTGI